MKKLKSAIVALTLLGSVSAHAEGIQIGTAPILLAAGVTNISAQFQLGDDSAIVARHNSISGTYLNSTIDLTSYSIAYKGYFNTYADGGYWEVGAANLDVTASTSSDYTAGNALIPIVVLGYEWGFDSGVVLGVEGGVGTGGGLGLLGVNASYQF